MRTRMGASFSRMASAASASLAHHHTGMATNGHGNNRFLLSAYKAEPTAGAWTQTYHLTVREAKGFVRDVPNLIARVGSVVVLTVLIAVIFLSIGDQNRKEYSTQSHFGLVVYFLYQIFFYSRGLTTRSKMKRSGDARDIR